MNWGIIVIKNNVLKDLIVSLEEYTGQPVDETTKEQLEQDLDAIDTAQVSLEAYCNAYNLLQTLGDKQVLSMETFSDILALAEKNVVGEHITVSMEDDTSSDGLLKKVKDKIIAAFKWLVEKINNLMNRLHDFVAGVFRSIGRNAKKVNTWLREITGFKRDVHIPLKDVYLIVKNDHDFYSTKELETAVKYLYEDLPDACAKFIEGVADAIPRSKLYLFDMESGQALRQLFSDKQNTTIAKTVVKNPVENKEVFQKDGIQMLKIKGVNVAVGAGFMKDPDIIVGSVAFGDDVLGSINPSIKTDTISITTKDFEKVRDLAEMLEKEIEHYESNLTVKKELYINRSLEDLKNDILKNLGSAGASGEQIAPYAQTFLTTFITRSLNGVFRMRAESVQAATQVLACTNRLIWKVYVTETSDSKELVVA